MINIGNAYLVNCIVHRVGNKYLSESLRLSNEELELSEDLEKQLQEFFLKPLKNIPHSYSFYHNTDLKMNEVFAFSNNIFEDESFLDNSVNIVKHLYEETKHPSIKDGEVFIARFKDIIIEDNFYEGIGIFKSEKKDNFFIVDENESKININIQNGINQQKLDKACLIVNKDYHLGFTVYAYEQNNNDTVYWKDEFLKLKVRNDNFNQTNNTLSIYKNFVTQKLDDEFEMSKADKIDLLNRSMKYFKEKDTFEMDEFAGEVLGNNEAIESFKNYKNQYEQEYDTVIPDSFEISDNAVKKQARVYKSVLKLDRNFHIYIHGDKDLIEKGFDDAKAMNYYKVYFKEEE